MASKVPISVENIAFERLNLSRHYLTIDCDFTCYIVLNPSGVVPSEGTDICALHVGAWQIDAWTLLTKKDFPNQAGFVACLVWDKTLVVEGSTSVPHVVESDIDTANSVSTLKGQPVNITGFSMPEGSSLPVSLFSSAFEEPISISNPLPVRDVRRRFYRFYVSSVYPLSDIREIGAGFERVEGDDDVYICSPSAWFAQISQVGQLASGVLCFCWGNVTHWTSTPSSAADTYVPIYSYIEIYRNRETGVFSRIAFKGWLFGHGGTTDIRQSDSEIRELDITCP